MSEEKLTRKQLLARLAYCEFEFGVGTQGFTDEDVVDTKFYSNRGYYDCSDEELVTELRSFFGEIEELRTSIDWDKVDEEYSSWGDTDAHAPVTDFSPESFHEFAVPLSVVTDMLIDKKEFIIKYVDGMILFEEK